MPRTAPALIRKAKQISPNVATLLLPCRDLASALNEYRWIKQHVESNTAATHRRRRIAQLCVQRGKGVPLQYILGSQPFGPLDIQCKPDVLIPRQETEAYTYHVANLVKSNDNFRAQANESKNSLRILDLCTGSGCIPLLLFALLQKSFVALDVQGVDVSATAIGLSALNKYRNIQAGNLSDPGPQQSLRFTLQDIFDDEGMKPFTTQPWDIITSNPPYISPRVWNTGLGQLGHSVRKYEPKLALVPASDTPLPKGWSLQDVFYARLLQLTSVIQPKLLLTELGDKHQAERVLERFFELPIADQYNVEVWRDSPDLFPDTGDRRLPIKGSKDDQHAVKVVGLGEIRSLVFTKK